MVVWRSSLLFGAGCIAIVGWVWWVRGMDEACYVGDMAGKSV